jgi:hypothetical protein
VGWGPRDLHDQDNSINLEGRKNGIKQQAEELMQQLKNLINGLGN